MKQKFNRLNKVYQGFTISVLMIFSVVVLFSCASSPTITLKDGSSYSGEVNQDGLPHGKGTQVIANGGTLTFDSKVTYQGQFKDGKYNGDGVLKWTAKNGIVIKTYWGEFKDGKENGKGNQILFTGETYEGEWKDGKMHGQGTLKRPKAFTVTGEFKNDYAYKGTMIWPDGRKFEGEFKDGNQIWSKGKCYNKEGKPVNCNDGKF